MAKFGMKSIPSDKKRGWTVKIDGKEQAVGLIELESKFGKLIYGLRPEGYDSWVFCEVGGGGSVTALYAKSPSGEPLVGLVLESRDNMGEQPVWCVAGGFLERGETHRQAMMRECAEETGLDTTKTVELAGLPANSNRLFFVADPRANEGVHAGALEIPFDELEQEDGCTKWRLKDIALLPGFKKAGDIRFFRWRDAVKITADALARSAIAQLLAAVL